MVVSTRNKKVKPRRALNNKSVKGSERKRSLVRIFLIIIYGSLIPFCLYRVKLDRTRDFVEENRPTILVPRTASVMGVQMATEESIMRSEEDET